MCAVKTKSELVTSFSVLLLLSVKDWVNSSEDEWHVTPQII